MAMRLQLDNKQFRTYLREMRTLHGDRAVNGWLRTAFGGGRSGPVSKPLIDALKSVTPKRRKKGSLRTSVTSQILNIYLGQKRTEPVLAVGGRLAKRGFIYNFLRGTKQRKTRKGYNRGRVANLRLAEKAMAIGYIPAYAAFIRRFQDVVNASLRKVRTKVKSASTGQRRP